MSVGWPHLVLLDPHNAGLALARTMIRSGAGVTVLVEPQEPYVARSRGVESVVSPFGVDGEQWMTALIGIAARHKKVAALPATDRASALLRRGADRLPDNVVMFERGSVVHDDLMDKARADAIARRAGVLVPWSARVAHEQDLAGALEAARWPCVVKPVLSHEWRQRFGETRAFLAEDGESAARLIRAPLNAGLEMMLCQYIPGGDEDVEEAIVVRLADGSYPVRFGCRKLRQYPPGFGVTALGESSTLPETMSLAERVLDTAGFVGVAGVETKRHSETGERWFIEANVRLPAQWGLGDASGVDASRRLLTALCGGGSPPQPQLRTQVRFAQPDVDWHLVLPAIRAAPAWQRPMTAWKLLRPYLGAGEAGMLSVSDPQPGIAFAGAFIRRRVKRS